MHGPLDLRWALAEWEPPWEGVMARGSKKTPQHTGDPLLNPWGCKFPRICSGFLFVCPADWKAELILQGDKDVRGWGEGTTSKEQIGHQESCTRWSEDVCSCRICQLEGDNGQHPVILKFTCFAQPLLQDFLMILLNLKTNLYFYILYCFGFLKWRVYKWARMSKGRERTCSIVTKILRPLRRKHVLLLLLLRSFSELQM